MAEWSCQRCHAQNAADAAACYFCGADRTAEVEASHYEVPADWSIGPGGEVAMVPSATPLGIGPGGLVGGLLVGAAAAIAATAAWYLIVALTSYQIGFVAVIVGWLIGTAIVFGARGRLSWALIGGSVVLTLVALAVGEYLIFYHLLTEYARTEFGFTGSLELIQSPEVMLDMVYTSIEADPLTLAFWAMALAAAAWVPFRALRPSE
jgi:hypothetical protein